MNQRFSAFFLWCLLNTALVVSIPLSSIENEWEEFLREHYNNQEDKGREDYRVYDENTSENVKQFYLENHVNQTLAFVQDKKKEYLPLHKAKMGIWEALKLLDNIVDESDPDISLPQSYHCYQTAEALRRDGHPRWLIATGFIHDLGKILEIYGEPQWAIVGDTFPLGCKWSDKIVFPQYFLGNPDSTISEYQTPDGIYKQGCGLDQVHMSWGHDEYLYHVIKNYLPREAGFIIRYHSFYSLHREDAYQNLLNEEDKEMLHWLKLFSQYDLYSKSPDPIDMEKLRPYYEELLAEFFPDLLQW